MMKFQAILVTSQVILVELQAILVKSQAILAKFLAILVKFKATFSQNFPSFSPLYYLIFKAMQRDKKTFFSCSEKWLSSIRSILP